MICDVHINKTAQVLPVASVAVQVASEPRGASPPVAPRLCRRHKNSGARRSGRETPVRARAIGGTPKRWQTAPESGIPLAHAQWRSGPHQNRSAARRATLMAPTTKRAKKDEKSAANSGRPAPKRSLKMHPVVTKKRKVFLLYFFACNGVAG